MPLTREDFKKKFEDFDKDKNGKLTLSELHQHINELLKTTVSDLAAKNIFHSLDKSNDGFVTLDEWLDLLDRKPLKDVGKEDLKETLKKIDKNGDGKVDKNELKEAMKSKTKLSDAQLDKFISEHDKDGDGKINTEEFIDGYYHDA